MPKETVMLRRFEQILFFLTILFLPTQLGLHFWPGFSFIYSLPIDYLSPTLYFWDLLALALWITFLLSGKHINRLALIFFYFFILTQAISLLFNTQSVGVGLSRLEQYVIAGLFGVYVASLNIKKDKLKISLPLTISLIGVSILAIIQFLQAGSIGFWILGERNFLLSTPGIAKFNFYGNEFLRPYATFPHPNVLAGFILISLLILPVRKMIMILGGLALLLTTSRVAILSGFVTAIFLIKGQSRKLLILMAILLLPILYTLYSSVFSFDNLTLLRREELTISAFKMIQQHFLFGIGLNNFIPTVATFLLTGPSRFLQPVHNIFLLCLSETGIVGLVGLLGLIGYPIFKKKLLIVWISIVFLGLFDHYFLTLPQGYRSLFLVWGLSLSMLE